MIASKGKAARIAMSLTMAKAARVAAAQAAKQAADARWAALGGPVMNDAWRAAMAARR